MKNKTLPFVLAMGVVISVPARATLIDRGSGLIYDDVLKITWTQNANLWNQTGTWNQAVAWAAGVSFGGFDDWRLASMSVAGGLPTGSAASVVNCSTATESDCRDNELGYMYYQNLGGSIGDNLTGNRGLMQNIQFDYWSGTELFALNAWAFGFENGAQFSGVITVAAWAVRPGDVLAVPEPATWLLLAAGLAGIGFSRRRGRPRRR